MARAALPRASGVAHAAFAPGEYRGSSRRKALDSNGGDALSDDHEHAIGACAARTIYEWVTASDAAST